MLPGLAAEATAFLLLFARLGSFLMLLPLTGDESVPGRIRLMFGLGLTLALFGLLRANVATAAGLADTELLRLLVLEVIVGLALGTIVRTLMHAATMAGSIISLQVGFTSALILDPALGGHTPLIGKLVALGAILVCLALGVHQLWFEALVRSYVSFPVGAVPNSGDMLRLALSALNEAMRIAVSLAAPFLIYGILFNTALGLASRLAPAIQIFFIAQPLNLALGLALLALTAGAILTQFADAYAGWLLNGWARV